MARTIRIQPHTTVGPLVLMLLIAMLAVVVISARAGIADAADASQRDASKLAATADLDARHADRHPG
jgi:hypothetical protein